MSEFVQKNNLQEQSKMSISGKEQVSENGLSKIWSEITVNRSKQIREVIQIGEQRSNSHHQAEQAVQYQIEKVQKQNRITEQVSNMISQLSQGIDLNYKKSNESVNQTNQIQENSQQNKATQKQIIDKTNGQQQKDGIQYISMKQLFQNGQMNLDIWKELKQNDKIFSIKRSELFKDILDDRKQQFKQMQIQAVQWLFKNYSKPTNKTQVNQSTQKIHEYNILRTVDLLYKKYVVSPLKTNSLQIQNQAQKPIYDIYKPNIVYCERKHPLIDNSPSNNFPQTFKRNGSGKNYNGNYVSLVENQSTNQNQNYLEAIANNYVNGIRTHKFTDSPTNSQSQKTPTSQPLDKFRKYGNPNPEVSLPFDIDIYDNGSKRQYNNEYNMFQSSDDDKSERFKQEKMVAKTFIKDGYGLQIIRNYMGPSMDGGTYNRAITTIIRESYKKIEDFLTKNCNMKIHCLTSQEFSLVKTPLVHCRNILKNQDLNTFFKYIGITYSIWKLKKEEYPTAQETLSLYQSILRGLSDRKTAKDHMPKPSSHRDLYYR